MRLAPTKVTLGLLGHSASITGLAHGINALLLFTVALLAGLKAWRVAALTAPAESVPAVA